MIPFKAKIENVVTNYTDILVDSAAPAIMAWALDGAKLFAENGFDLPARPAVIEDATDAYFLEESWLDQFLEECCVKMPGGKVQVGTLYSVYRFWGNEGGERILPVREFSKQLSEYGNGLEVKNGGGHKRYIYGIELQDGFKNFG